MHVQYPKTYAYQASNSFIEVDHSRYCEWYSVPEEEVDLDIEDYSYFRENRRKTFSDVSHAKVLAPKGSKYNYPFMRLQNWIFAPALLVDKDYVDNSGRPHSIYGSISGMGQSYELFRVEVRNRDDWYTAWDATVLFGAYKKRDTRYIYRTRCSFNITGSLRISTGDKIKASVDTVSPSVGLPADVRTSIIDSVKIIASSWRKPAEKGDISPYRAMRDHFVELKTYFLSIARNIVSTSTTMQTLNPKHDPEIIDMHLGEDTFLFHEPSVILGHDSELFHGTGNAGYFREVLVQNAYMDLVENVPKLNDNNISNLLEISQFISNLVIHKKVEVPKNLSSGWLAYRYSYGTGKQDVEEAIKYVNRHTNLAGKSTIKCYGSSSLTYQGVNVHCRCVATVTQRQLDKVKKLWSGLVKYGLTPDFYVIWDMIPYSFIADWFLPIGDILARWDANRQMDRIYDVKDVQFSLKYNVNTDPVYASCYTRWLTGTPPVLQGRYTFERDASDKTVIKRVIDAASLIIG